MEKYIGFWLNDLNSILVQETQILFRHQVQITTVYNSHSHFDFGVNYTVPTAFVLSHKSRTKTCHFKLGNNKNIDRHQSIY